MHPQAGEEVVDRQHQLAFADPRVLAHQILGGEAQVYLGDALGQVLGEQRQRHRLGYIGTERGEFVCRAEAAQPVLDQRPLRGWSLLQLPQGLLVGIPYVGRLQALLQTGQQLAGVLAEDELDTLGGQFLHQVFGGLKQHRLAQTHALLGDIAGHGLDDFRLQLQQTVALTEQLLDMPGAARALRPLSSVVVALRLAPEEAGETTGQGAVAEQPGAVAQRQQLDQDQRRVVVMDALLIAFLVTWRSEVADALDQGFRLRQLLLEQVEAEAIAPGIGGSQYFAGQVFGAVQINGLGLQRHLPVIAQRFQLGVLQRFEKFGAGQVQIELIAARHQGQI
jgi:hypothetical protein